MEMKDILKQHTDALDKSIEGFGTKLQEFTVRLADIEQKSSRNRGGGGEALPQSLGGAFTSADGFSAFAADDSRASSFRVETKAILTSDPAVAGAAAPNPYLDTIVALPKRKLVVRSLLPVVPVSTGAVLYPKMTARNNNAAMTAETGQKPQSDVALAMQTLPIRKIAHFIKASSEIVADAPQLKGLIDTELLYGVALVEDTQLLLGDGTGVNLTGMVPNATAYAVPSGITIANPNFMDELGLAMLQCALADYNPDGIVLHPTDWLKIRLTKDANGKYILGDPGAEVEPRLFGLPVVATKAMPQGHFLVGEFAVAVTLYDRMQAMILASTEDGNNFQLNLVTILAEERIALAIKQGTALIYGAFT